MAKGQANSFFFGAKGVTLNTDVCREGGLALMLAITKAKVYQIAFFNVFN